ncbi:MAG: hypothetical protein ABH952_12720 [Candidatus Omnitrophota bacterium]
MENVVVLQRAVLSRVHLPVSYLTQEDALWVQQEVEFKEER